MKGFFEVISILVTMPEKVDKPIIVLDAGGIVVEFSHRVFETKRLR